MIDGATTTLSSSLATTASSASALARRNRVRSCALAPSALKKTKRRTPAASAAWTMRHVAMPLSSSIEPRGWSRMAAARCTTVVTPRSALRNDGGSARSPRAIWTRTRSAPSRRGSRTRQRTGVRAAVRRRSTAEPTRPVAPVSSSMRPAGYAPAPTDPALSPARARRAPRRRRWRPGRPPARPPVRAPGGRPSAGGAGSPRSSLSWAASTCGLASPSAATHGAPHHPTSCTKGANCMAWRPSRAEKLYPDAPDHLGPPFGRMPRPTRRTTARGTRFMAYVITEPCIGTKDNSCVEVCPVDCIHPTPDEPDYDSVEMLYIAPEECIDCDACVEACPVDACFAEDQVPDEWNKYVQINADYFKKA